MVSPVTSRRFGVSGNLGVKAPVRAATTANITLSGEQTIDGVAVVADDRVLVKNQTSAIDNGIYDVSTGSWTRSIDFNGVNDVVTGTGANITEGTQAGIFAWITTTGDIIPGTDAMNFSVNADLSSLAGSGGSSLIGHIADLPSAVARTMQSKARDTVSVFDFMTQAEIDDAIARTGLVDHTAAIQAAVDSAFLPELTNFGGARLHFPKGKYNLTTVVTLPNSQFYMFGDGVSTQIATVGCSAFLYDGGFTSISYCGDMLFDGDSTAATEVFNTNPSAFPAAFSAVHFERIRAFHYPRMFNIPNAQLCSWTDCMFQPDAGGSTFYIHPTQAGQAANANRVTRCQFTGTATTIDFVPFDSTTRATEWVFSECDFQQSGVVVPMYIIDSEYTVDRCEFENSGAAQVIHIESTGATLQPKNTRIIGNTIGGGATALKVKITKTGTQIPFGTVLISNNAGNGAWLDDGGQNTLAISHQGTIVDTAGTSIFRVDMSGGQVNAYQANASSNRGGARLDALSGGAALGKNLAGSVTFGSTVSAIVSFDATRQEPDTGYHLQLTPGTSEQIWWTTKSTTGFTLNSSNTASTSAVDWFIVRGST